MDWKEVRPILVATYQLLDGEEFVTQEAVCEAVGKPPRDERTIRALALLYESGYIDGHEVDNSPAPMLIRATEKGLREASNWPRDGGPDQGRPTAEAAR